MREEAFVQHLRGAPLLLVHLSGAEDPLLAALTASASLGGDLVPPSPDGLPFRTATVPLHVAMKTFALRSRGLVGLIYAVVLHKRAGSQTLSEHRICIGRSRNTDIVLRDESVSKLHAWFERDEDGNYSSATRAVTTAPVSTASRSLRARRGASPRAMSSTSAKCRRPSARRRTCGVLRWSLRRGAPRLVWRGSLGDEPREHDLWPRGT